MEFGGREILIGLGLLLVIAILLDGFRRSRSRREGKLRVRRRRQPIFNDDDLDKGILFSDCRRLYSCSLYSQAHGNHV